MSEDRDTSSNASDWTTIDDQKDFLAQLFDADQTTFQFGAWSVVEEIGRGASSTVFRAKHQKTGEIVALKVLEFTIGWHRARERFEHEIAQHRRLDHPNIAKILDTGVVEIASGRRVPWLAVELVEGGSIKKHVEVNQFNNRQIIELIIQVCRGVGHAHEMGLVHRDLKPANICVTKDGNAKLLDFGLVRDLQGESGPTMHTAHGVLIGTPAYMPPEQAVGNHAGVGPMSDVYSIAAILFELLTGELPVPLEEGLPIPQAVAKIVNAPSRSIRKFGDGFDVRLDAILSKALSKEVPSRYTNASELGNDLQAYLDKQPLSVKPPSVFKQIRRSAREHRQLVRLGLIALLVLSTIALFAVMRERRARDVFIMRAMERQARRDNAYQYVRKAWEASDDGRNQDALVWLTAAMKLDLDDPDRIRTRRLQYASIKALSPRIIKQDPITTAESAVRFGDLYIEHESPVNKNSITRVFRDGVSEPIHTFERERGCFVGEFSPDGRVIVLGFEFGKDFLGGLEFIEVSSGKTFKTIDFKSSVKSIDFNRDGSLICVSLWDSPDTTSGQDGHVLIVRVSDFEIMSKFVTPETRLTSAQWSPDESKIVTASIDGPVHLFDVKTGQVINSFQLPHQNHMARFSADGRHIVVSDAINDCRVWNVVTGKPASPSIRFGGELRDARLNEDSTQLTILTEGLRTVWDLQPDPAYQRRLSLPSDIRALRISPDFNRAMLLSSVDGNAPFRLDTLDCNTGQIYRGNSYPDINFQWISNSQVVVGNDAQERTIVLHALTHTTIKTLCEQPRVKESDTPRMKVFPDHGLAAIPVGFGYSIYDHKTGDLKSVDVVSHCTDVELSNDGRVLYFSRTGKDAAMIAVNYPELTVKWEHPMSTPSRCSDVRLSQDQRLVMASLPLEGSVDVFDAATGKPVGNPILSNGGWLSWSAFLGKGDSLALQNGGVRRLSVHDSRTGSLLFAPVKDATAFRTGAGESGWIWIQGSKSYLMDGLTNERLTPSFGDNVIATPDEKLSSFMVEEFKNGQLVCQTLSTEQRPLDELVAEARMYSYRKLDTFGDLLPVLDSEIQAQIDTKSDNIKP